MTYMTRSWKICRDRSIGDDCQIGFAKHLRKTARPTQIAFVQIMRKHNGNPVGIEFRNQADPQRWAFVLQDATQPGFRTQYFDTLGFSGHAHFDDLNEAVEEMVTHGFRIEDAGALDRLVFTPKWSEGMAWIEAMQKHHRSRLYPV